MRKLSVLLLIFVSKVCQSGSAQITSFTSLFAGKWEITVTGLPDGDTKFVTDLVRKDKKLTGEFKDPTGKRSVAPITKVEEGNGKITIFMDTAQASEIDLEPAKADEDPRIVNRYV